MARKPLRSQLNQIRAWVRQGRTDAWIAHQLDVPASELREFRRRHELAPEDEDGGDLELRDEIEAEIEQATLRRGDRRRGGGRGGGGGIRGGAGGRGRRGRRGRRRPRATSPAAAGAAGAAAAGARPGAAMQATFDHGADDGFGLWLDPAVADDPVYSEHWAGHRQVEVTIEPDRIVIKRA